MGTWLNLMTFRGMLDGAGAGGALPAAAAATAPLGFSSPALSLGLHTTPEVGQVLEMSGGLEAIGGDGAGAGELGRRGREADENDSRSGSDNLDGFSGDDLDGPENSRRKKKRYHRHTPQQIQELEAAFKDCPHPDEKQRLELSRRLSLESRQVKFWFQNRRTQMKTQIERHENTLLKQENDKLRAENITIREAIRTPMCNNCGGPAMLGEASIEEQHLRIENARLKDELDRVCAIANKFLNLPVKSYAGADPSSLPCSMLELAVGCNGYPGLGSIPPSYSGVPDFMLGLSGMTGSAKLPGLGGGGALDSPGVLEGSFERTVLLELALSAMDELVKLAQLDGPLWIPGFDGMDTLNFDEYHRSFRRVTGPRLPGFAAEATRESGLVIMDSVSLVDSLMDANRWGEQFRCIVSRASTSDIISNGMDGTRNTALHLIHADLQVLSPLVPMQRVSFLRFCKQHAEGLWAVVDVSIDGLPDHSLSPAGTGGNYCPCRLLPSGCLVQDMPNGYSKVTWVAHSEYDEAAVHPLFQPLLRSGLALGSRRWLNALQRQSECMAILMSSSVPAPSDNSVIDVTAAGRRSMMKLAQRMTDNFCAGVCASVAQKWRRFDEWEGGAADGDTGVRMMIRQNPGDPSEAPGFVLSAATSVRIAGSPPERVFDYLRNERRRGEWDILANSEPMQEMAHIAKGQNPGNAVSLLRANATTGNQNGMLIFQETSTDTAGAMVVYAPVDVPAMNLVMNGGDSAFVTLLPSGFAILPDGHETAPGSLVTVAFQILLNDVPNNVNLTIQSAQTVSQLLSKTVGAIQAALQLENAAAGVP